MRGPALVVAWLAAGLCHVPASGPGPAAAPAPGAGEVAQVLFLIGDGGHPAPAGEPVLAALRLAVARAGAPATVAFLGDNVYPSGLGAPDRPGHEESARRLDAQLNAVRGAAARVVFIPGNHDWAKGGPGGWDAVRRQEQRLRERGDEAVSFAPGGGCPGPEVLDVGARLRLVALDTQWWLHRHARPQGAGSGCAAGSEDAVVAAFRAALEPAAGRDVVVLAHHPLESGGPHGGGFGFREHVFPLTEWKKGFYLPLPVVGSLYPIARSSGVSAQDIASDAYQRLRTKLSGAMRDRRPLAWASGHEHALQVIETREWGRTLVSGAGYFGHVSAVHPVRGSLYGAARSGFMRVDFLRDGRRRLAVVAVERDASAGEAFARLLD